MTFYTAGEFLNSRGASIRKYFPFPPTDHPLGAGKGKEKEYSSISFEGNNMKRGTRENMNKNRRKRKDNG